MLPLWLGVLAAETAKDAGNTALDWVKALGPFAALSIALFGAVFWLIKAIAENAANKVRIKGLKDDVQRFESLGLPDMYERKIKLLEADKRAVDSTNGKLTEQLKQAEDTRDAASAEARAAKAAEVDAISKMKRKLAEESDKYAAAIAANKRAALSPVVSQAALASAQLADALSVEHGASNFHSLLNALRSKPAKDNTAMVPVMTSWAKLARLDAALHSKRSKAADDGSAPPPSAVVSP